jgi:signal transduction histidine kinase
LDAETAGKNSTRAIAEKIEREAILQERMRIAREFHDSLEQELAGVKMQLELTAATVAMAPETAVANLQMAKTMISHSQGEVRRSVWELRSQVMENRTLPTALAATVGSVENGAPVEVKVTGQAHTLPMRIESNLLRIAQEAITNAIRHAKPRHIFVHLAYEDAGTRLKIADDGCGFYVARAPAAQEGHFGLLGMRERVDKIAGTLLVSSAPGKGTCVEVFVPAGENGVKKT